MMQHSASTDTLLDCIPRPHPSLPPNCRGSLPMDTVESAILRRRAQSAGVSVRSPSTVQMDRARPPTAPSAAAEVVLASARGVPTTSHNTSSSSLSHLLKYFPPCDPAEKTPQQKQAEEIRRQQQGRPPSSPRASYMAAERVLLLKRAHEDLSQQRRQNQQHGRRQQPTSDGCDTVTASEILRAEREIGADPFDNVLQAALEAARESRNDPLKRVMLAGGLLGVPTKGPVINELTGTQEPDVDGDLSDPDTRIIALASRQYKKNRPFPQRTTSATVAKYRDRLERVMKESDGPAFRATERTRFSTKVPMSAFDVKLHVDDPVALSAQISSDAAANRHRSNAKAISSATNTKRSGATSASAATVFDELDTVVRARKTLVALKSVPEHVFKSNAYLQKLFGAAYEVLNTAVDRQQRKSLSLLGTSAGSTSGPHPAESAEGGTKADEPPLVGQPSPGTIPPFGLVPEDDLVTDIKEDNALSSSDDDVDDEVFLGPSAGVPTRRGQRQQPRPTSPSRDEVDTESLSHAARRSVEAKLFSEWNDHLQSLTGSIAGQGAARTCSTEKSTPTTSLTTSPRRDRDCSARPTSAAILHSCSNGGANAIFTEEELRVLFADFVAKRGYTAWAVGGGDRFDPLRLPYSDVRRGSGERSRPGSAAQRPSSRGSAPTSPRRVATSRPGSGCVGRPLSGRPPNGIGGKPPQSTTQQQHRRPDTASSGGGMSVANAPPELEMVLAPRGITEIQATAAEESDAERPSTAPIPVVTYEPTEVSKTSTSSAEAVIKPSMVECESSNAAAGSRPASVMDDVLPPSAGMSLQENATTNGESRCRVETASSTTRRQRKSLGGGRVLTAPSKRPANTPMMGSRPASRYERSSAGGEQRGSPQPEDATSENFCRRLVPTPNPPGGLFLRSADRAARLQQLIAVQEQSANDRLTLINRYKRRFLKDNAAHENPEDHEGATDEQPTQMSRSGSTRQRTESVTQEQLEAVQLSHLPQDKVDELYARIVSTEAAAKEKRRQLSPKSKRIQEKEDALRRRQEGVAATLQKKEITQHESQSLLALKRTEAHNRQQCALYNRYNVVHLPGVVDQRFRRTLQENPPLLGVEGKAQTAHPLDVTGSRKKKLSRGELEGGFLFL